MTHAHRTLHTLLHLDTFLPEVGIATLERFGRHLDYPRDLTCCGQPMANSGFGGDRRNHVEERS
jgi:Fe-S oxidoreductase